MKNLRFGILFAVAMTPLLALVACGDDSTTEASGAGSTSSVDSSESATASTDKDDDHDGEDKDDDHEDESKSGLGSHEHGTAELSVAWSGSDVVIDFISPAMNIYGFEYEPTTDEDKNTLEDSNKTLSTPGLVAINDEAGCEVTDDVATEFEVEGSHAEVTTTWNLACEHADKIEQLDASLLFEEFPSLEDVDAEWASDSGQSSAELSPSATVLRFE